MLKFTTTKIKLNHVKQILENQESRMHRPETFVSPANIPNIKRLEDKIR
jgi:hypothetical protein